MKKTVTVYNNDGMGKSHEVREVWLARNGRLMPTEKPGYKPVSAIVVDGKTYILTQGHQLC